MATETRAISNKSVYRAGRRLRAALTRGADVRDDPEEFEKVVRAINLVADYRSMHAYPLLLVNNGLRAFVERESGMMAVAQRLKRMPAIATKLVRYPNMDLSRMQDIGGCRAVLEDAAEVRGVARRIRKNWDVVEVYDYREHGADRTGYRGLHFVVRRRGRLIEIQLRTGGQHLWAEEVELATISMGYPLKEGRGPAELVEYFRQASHLIAYRERGEEPPQEFMIRFENLREEVGAYFR